MWSSKESEDDQGARINLHQTRNRTLLADLSVKNKCWIHAECVGVRLKAQGRRWDCFTTHMPP